MTLTGFTIHSNRAHPCWWLHLSTKRREMGWWKQKSTPPCCQGHYTPLRIIHCLPHVILPLQLPTVFLDSWGLELWHPLSHQLCSKVSGCIDPNQFSYILDTSTILSPTKWVVGPILLLRLWMYDCGINLICQWISEPISTVIETFYSSKWNSYITDARLLLSCMLRDNILSLPKVSRDWWWWCDSDFSLSRCSLQVIRIQYHRIRNSFISSLTSWTWYSFIFSIFIRASRRQSGGLASTPLMVFSTKLQWK